MRAAILLALPLLTFAQDEKTELRWKLKKGDRLQLTWKIRLASGGENLQNLPNAELYRNDLEVVISGDAEVKDLQGESASLEVKVTRFASRGTAQGRKSEIEYENGELKKANLELPEFDRPALQQKLAAPIRLSVDRRGGVKLESWGADAAGAPTYFGGTLPEKPVGPGDAWEEKVAPLEGNGISQELVLKCRFEKSVDAGGGRAAVLVGSGEQQMDAMGAKARVRMKRETTFAIDGGFVVTSVEERDTETRGTDARDPRAAPVLRSNIRTEFTVTR